MVNSAPDLADRRNKAIERFQSLFEWYERTRTWSKLAFYVFQILVIVLSGMTPILILATDSKVTQAIPAALASILAGLMGVFQFSEHWTRRSATAELLKSELIKFETRATDDYSDNLSEADVIRNFVLKIEAIQADAVAQWRRSREVAAGSTKTLEQPGAAPDATSEPTAAKTGGHDG